MRRSTARLEQLLSRLPRRHPKVGDLDVLVLVKKKVLGLEISVADVEAMAVVDGMDDLLEVVERLLGRESAARDEVVEELAAGDVFHDQVAARPQVENASEREGEEEERNEGRGD